MAHSHTHLNTTITSSSVGHGQDTAKSGTTKCPATGSFTHDHYHSTGSGGAHTHNFILSYGSGNLGSPNWWEHTHPITLSLETAAGPSHNHTLDIVADGCDKVVGSTFCIDNPHPHADTYAVANTAFSHSNHTAVGTTGNADPAGTPESHVHSVSFNSGSISTGHTHTVTGSITANRCYFTASTHGHTALIVTDVDAAHLHSLSGNSGPGGEAVPKKKAGLHPSKILPLILDA